MHNITLELSTDPAMTMSSLPMPVNLHSIDLAPSESKPKPVIDTSVDPVTSPLDGVADSKDNKSE
jgi:hypothetical protein